MKERNIFLASVFATTLIFSTYNKIYKDGKIDQDSLSQFKTSVSQAFDTAEKSILKVDNPIVNKCDCNGNKIIVHGDGHRTPCPCVGSATGCQCKMKSSEQIVTKNEIKLVKFFSRPNCVFCTKWEKQEQQRFIQDGWTVEKYQGEGIVPFFEFITSDKKKVTVGYTSLEDAKRILNEKI